MSRAWHPFAHVDDEKDPQAWIDVLDRLRADPLYARYKARVAGLADPAKALAEIARVVRPGGVVVVADPDYGTQVVNVPDQDLADRVLRFRAGVGNWRLAHQMRRPFVETGLTDVRAEAVPIVITDPAALDHALGLRTWAGLAAEQGLLDHADVKAWEDAVDTAAAGGWFLYSFSLFITSGRVAPHRT